MNTYLVLRPNGIYYIRVRENGIERNISTRSRNREAAEEFLARHLTRPEPEVTLSQFAPRIESFVESMLSPKSLIIYKACLGRLLKLVGDAPLKSINPETCVTYVARRRKGGLSPASISIEVRTFKRIWNLGIEWEILEKNPWKKVHLPRTEIAPAYLTPEEFEQLYRAIKQKYFRDFLMLAVLTGLRRSELGFMTWDNVDLQRHCMTVETNTHFRVKHGKRRVVPLHPKAIMILEQMEGKGDRLFDVHPEHMSHLFRKYRKDLKMRKELHLHSVRHTFASWLALDGTPTLDIKDLMGHSSIAVTQIYTHLPSEHLRGMVERIQIDL
jgi:integrase